MSKTVCLVIAILAGLLMTGILATVLVDQKAHAQARIPNVQLRGLNGLIHKSDKGIGDTVKQINKDVTRFFKPEVRKAIEDGLVVPLVGSGGHGHGNSGGGGAP